MKSVKTGISLGLNIIDCMTEMPEMLIIKLLNRMPDFQFKTHFVQQKRKEVFSTLRQVEGD